MRLPDPSPEFLIKFHVSMMVFWVAVTPITLKYPQSVLWVAFMSQYANFVGHFSGYDATRAEANESSDEVLAELRALRAMIEAQ